MRLQTFNNQNTLQLIIFFFQLAVKTKVVYLLFKKIYFFKKGYQNNLCKKVNYAFDL